MGRDTDQGGDGMTQRVTVDSTLQHACRDLRAATADLPPSTQVRVTVEVLPQADARIEAWLADLLAQGKAEATTRLWRRYAQEAQEALGDLTALTTDQVRSWIDGSAPSTAGNRVSALRSFYKYAVAQGLCTSNPAAAVKPPRVERKNHLTALAEKAPADLPRVLDDLDALDARVDRPVGQSRAIALVLAETGLRIAEACKLQLPVPAPSQVTVGSPKRRRVVQLTPLARHSLDTLGGRIPIDARAVQRRFEKVGISPQQLRYVRAREAVQEKRSPKEAREAIGVAHAERCIRGHELTDENTLLNAATGYRRCKACVYEQNRQRREGIGMAPCTAKGCDRPSFTRGLCRRCWDRSRAYKINRGRWRHRKMKRIVKLRAQGMGVEQAARAAGVDRSTVWRWRYGGSYAWFAAELDRLDGQVAQLGLDALIELQQQEAAKEARRSQGSARWDMSLDRPVAPDSTTTYGDLVASPVESAEAIVLRRFDAELDAYLTQLLRMIELQEAAQRQGRDPRHYAAASLGVTLDRVLKMEADVDAVRRGVSARDLNPYGEATSTEVDLTQLVAR